MPRIIDVLSHPNVMEDELVYREPQNGNGDFRMGSQVIVQEGQVAVFVRQGQALDVLGPGSHTLSTANLPILSGLIGMVTNGRNPFTAEVYYINVADLPNVRWGTSQPIFMKTPGFGPGFMLLITNGVVNIGIEDPMRFLKQYGMGRNILRLGDMRDAIQTMLLGELNNLISSQQITDLQAANALLNNIEAGATAMLNDQFIAYGMRIKKFDAQGFQAKDLTREDMIKFGGISYKDAEVLAATRDAAKNPGLAGTAAGAGVGFGVGQVLGNMMDPNAQARADQQAMMQQMMMQQMMQMMQNQGGAQPAPAQAAPVNNNPQTPAEIQALLDSLDVKLANGELSETAYNRLVEKWEKRLKELGG